MPFDCTDSWPPRPTPKVPSGRGALLRFVVAWSIACCAAGATILLIHDHGLKELLRNLLT